MSRFVIEKDYSYNVKRFDVSGRKIEFRVRAPPTPNEDVEKWIQRGVEEIVETLTQKADADDYIGITFCGKNFERGAGWLSFQPARELSMDKIWNIIVSVFQSNTEGLNTDSFCLGATIVKMPRGKGNNRAHRYATFTQECAMRRGIVTINNKDNLCLPRALVVAKAYVDKDPNYIKVRRDIGKMQTARTLALVQEFGIEIPPNGAGIEELKRFQQHMADYKITVYGYGAKGRDVVFEGPDAEKKINLLHHKGHYNVITSLTAAFCCGYYCETCHIPHDHKNDHRCGGTCPCCQQSPACSKEGTEILCTDCHRKFRGEQCFQRHKSMGSLGKVTVCAGIKQCPSCLKTFRGNRQHTCGEVFCHVCKKHQKAGHLCYIQPDTRTPPTKDLLFVFYDLETRQEKQISEGYLHEANLCVFQQRCNACLDKGSEVSVCDKCGVRRNILKHKPIQRFLEYVLEKRKTFKKVVVLGHNAQAFDTQFMLHHILTKTDLKPELIMRGTKIILMQLDNLKFLDSLNYLPMKLSALPKAFDLPPELKKGYFPYLFNTTANEFYNGQLPPINYYSSDTMMTEERAKFLEWYAEHKHDNFNMQRDLVEYCVSDVEILTQACLKFRDIMLKQCNVCPFTEATTIASACNLVFRRNFLQPNTIGIIPENGYRGRDKHSKIALKWLLWEADQRKINIQHAGNGSEAILNGVKVDGYCKDTNQIFEFQGCYYHGHTCIKYKRDDPLPDDPHDTLNRRYEATQAKIQRLRNFGYDVIEKWECEFLQFLKRNKETTSYLHSHPMLINVPLNPRDAFYGGRTGNTVTYYKCKPGEKIMYVDVCSLYPWACKYGKFPIGHPDILVGLDCSKVNLNDINGLIKCTILPPQDLFHPVLPVKANNKLLFVLCQKCGDTLNQEECTHTPSERAIIGTWVLDEVIKAIEVGYEIQEIHEIWNYAIAQLNKEQPGLFGKFINRFLKMKQQASGFPSNCKTQEERDKYIEEFLEREDIQMEFDLIVKNAGLRCLAKLILNSFWGKYGQRENLPKTSIINQPDELFTLLTNPAIDVNTILPVNDETLIVNWEYKEEAVTGLPTVNVCIAAYTTAQARLKLYSYLEKLGDRVLYYDTDSVIYISREGEWDVPTGSFLGEMTNELEEYGPDSYITEFASGGPKHYSYKVFGPSTGKYTEKIKVKGFTLNFETSQIINFNKVKEMVLDNGAEETITYSRIGRSGIHEIVTRKEEKVYKVTSNKRKFEGTKSVPYGFKKPRLSPATTTSSDCTI